MGGIMTEKAIQEKDAEIAECKKWVNKIFDSKTFERVSRLKQKYEGELKDYHIIVDWDESGKVVFYSLLHFPLFEDDYYVKEMKRRGV
jgi:hypothetical protein